MSSYPPDFYCRNETIVEWRWWQERINFPISRIIRQGVAKMEWYQPESGNSSMSIALFCYRSPVLAASYQTKPIALDGIECTPLTQACVFNFMPANWGECYFPGFVRSGINRPVRILNGFRSTSRRFHPGWFFPL